VLLQDVVERDARRALHRLGDVRVVVEHVAQIEHADLGRDRGEDRRAGDHHVDRADLDLLHDVALLAQLVVGEVFDLEAVRRARLQALGEVLLPHVVGGVVVGQHRRREAERNRRLRARDPGSPGERGEGRVLEKLTA
jgi:hypothetical protein